METNERMEMESQNCGSYAPREVKPTVGGWLVTLLILNIPLVNIVMLFVWAFGGGTSPCKSNWAKAMLLFWLIVFVLCIIIFGVAGLVDGYY